MLWSILCVAAALVALAAMLVWVVERRAARSKRDELAGYISDLAVVEREFAAAHGKPLTNAEAPQLFQQASELARKGDVRQAADLLETVSKTVAVPAIFNDLGVLYAKVEDRSRTLNAFREALARDPDYAPVRQNLARLRNITEDEARPLTREIEPNPTNSMANIIALGTPVEGEISAGLDDVDAFKFPAPPAPRDVVALDITSRSQDLILGWSLYDDQGNLISRSAGDPKPGAPVHFTFAPLPNTAFFLTLWGLNRTSGTYVISLKAMKSFDAYEPDDDIFQAHSISLGQPIQANIMDGQDQDFYTFLADRSGTVDMEVKNLSATLVPALTAFGPDKRTIGFAPDASGPGASLHYNIAVEAGQRYYVQVWPVLERSSGEYTLRLELR